MTIPPVGTTPGSPIPPDENNNQEQKPAPVENSQQTEKATQVNRERVEISPEARRIRRRQAEITRLQVAERAAQGNIDKVGVIDQMFADMAESQRSADQRRADAIQEQIENEVREFQGRKEAATYEGENLLDGREMRFEIDAREETVRTPDARREIDEYVRAVRDRVVKNKDTGKAEFFSESREFIRKSSNVRSRLEKDVRDSVAGAVKESTYTRLKDAAEAERMIKKARDSRPEKIKIRQQPDSGNQMEGRAVDLLK